MIIFATEIMSLIPLINEIRPTQDKHKNCNYTGLALLPSISYDRFHISECVSMMLVKVCPKCGKFKSIGLIPIHVDVYTIQKYGIDIDSNIKTELKQTVHIDFLCTAEDKVLNVTGYMQNLWDVTYIYESKRYKFNSEMEPLSIEVTNDIAKNQEIYTKLPYGFNGYDTHGNPQFLYQETKIINDIEVTTTYNKIVIM